MDKENRSSLPPLDKKTELKQIMNSDEYLLDTKNFKVINNISSDNFSSTKIVENIKTKQKYTSKTISLKTNSKNQITISKICNELLKIQTSTLNQYQGFSYTDFERKNNFTIFMSQQFRSLFDIYLDSSFNNTQKLKVLAGVTYGMSILHQHKITHGDLKLQNVLLKDNFHPIISDFGLFKFYGIQNLIKKNLSNISTAAYIAPEVVTSKQLTQNSDVYAFGILMYNILQETQAYSDLPDINSLSPSALIKKVQNGLRPTFKNPIKEDIKTIIEQCWSQNPNERPTFSKLFQLLSLLENGTDQQQYILDNVDIEEFSSYINLITGNRKSDSNRSQTDSKKSNDKLINENLELKKQNDQMKSQLSSVEEALFKFATFEIFNSLPLHSQLSLVSKEISTLNRPNSFLNKLNKILNFLRLFDHNETGSYIEVIGRNKEDPFRRVNKNCQLLLRSSALEMLFMKNSLDSQQLFNILKGFNTPVILEVSYPSDNYEKIYQTVIEIKEKLNGKLEIGIFIDNIERTDSTFVNNKEINSIRFGNSVLSIEGDPFSELGPFKGCSSLERVEISSSVKSIERRSFKDCESLKSIVIPSSVNFIGSYAFSNCKNLVELVIKSSSIFTIEERTFENCDALKKIVIPSTIASVGPDAFRGCKSLSKIELLNSVTYIGDGAFSECSSIKEVILPDSIKKIGNFTFDGCTSIMKVNVPSSVLEIGFRAFRGCTSLKEVTIPDSVKSIGDLAFEECNSIEKVLIPSSVTFFGNNAFPSTTNVIKS